jgi:hypothetical protein
LVADEDIAAHANDFKLMRLAVSVEEPRERMRDEIHSLHLLGRLSDQLLCWKYSLLKSIVCLDVLGVRIRKLAAVERKIFHLWILLNYDRRDYSRVVLCLNVRCLPLKFFNFFDDCNKETACILVVWHHSETFMQFSDDAGVIAV